MNAFVQATDCALRTLFAPHRMGRVNPAKVIETTCTLDAAQTQQVQSLMRVNHVGEVCAQALYTAQALGARVFHGDETLAQQLEHASQEEEDHLAWTHERLQELDGRTSYLTPLWYAGAFGLGVAASCLGKAISLGLVMETERQVEAHLDSHIKQLPAQDHASKAILEQMKQDEMQHAHQAMMHGGKPLPPPLPQLMHVMGRVMTTVASKV